MLLSLICSCRLRAVAFPVVDSKVVNWIRLGVANTVGDNQDMDLFQAFPVAEHSAAQAHHLYGASFETSPLYLEYLAQANLVGASAHFLCVLPTATTIYHHVHCLASTRADIQGDQLWMDLSNCL